MRPVGTGERGRPGRRPPYTLKQQPLMQALLGQTNLADLAALIHGYPRLQLQAPVPLSSSCMPSINSGSPLGRLLCRKTLRRLQQTVTDKILRENTN